VEKRNPKEPSFITPTPPDETEQGKLRRYQKEYEDMADVIQQSSMDHIMKGRKKCQLQKI